MDIPENLLPKSRTTAWHALMVHCVEVESAVPPEMALDPNFWKHLAERFSVGDELIIRPKDRAYRLHAEIVAKDVLNHWVLLRGITLSEGRAIVRGSKDESGYRIDHDPVQGWRILNGRDLIRRDLPDEAAAMAALAEIKAGPKADEPADAEGYRVAFAGPHRFRIFRGDDVVETDLPTKAAAYAKLAEIKAEKVAA